MRGRVGSAFRTADSKRGMPRVDIHGCQVKLTCCESCVGALLILLIFGMTLQLSGQRMHNDAGYREQPQCRRSRGMSLTVPRCKDTALGCRHGATHGFESALMQLSVSGLWHMCIHWCVCTAVFQCGLGMQRCPTVQCVGAQPGSAMLCYLMTVMSQAARCIGR